MKSLFLFQEIVLSKEKLKLEVIWGTLGMVAFCWGGMVVWLDFEFGFFWTEQLS